MEPESRFPPGVNINGNVQIGEGTYIGSPALVNGKDSAVVIGKGCDIASFVAINVADSHARCLGLEGDIERRRIIIGDHVFIGQGAIILGGCEIGDHAVIAAGVTLPKCTIVPPYSRVLPPPPTIQIFHYWKGDSTP